MAHTYSEIYLDMRRRLREAGVEEYALEARRLMMFADDVTEAGLISRMNLYINDETAHLCERLLQRRLRGEPAAYITGSVEFYGLPFLVNRDVLIPRMDTEVLVKTALELIPDRRAGVRVMDLCCGSGCIGCTIGRFLPASRVYLADISPEALAVCRKNVILNGLGTRCICMQADALSPPPIRMDSFDLLVSNPPYITTAEMDELDASVREWEPELALDGGPDGLVFYRSVILNWKSVLKDGGKLIFEVGEGQAEPVRAMLKEAGFVNVGGRLDTAGTERVVFGTKSK